jgi:hypothetical protein
MSRENIMYRTVQKLMYSFGFTRKVAWLIARIERGVDTLDSVTTIEVTDKYGTVRPLVGMSEYITIRQYLEGY